MQNDPTNPDPAQAKESADTPVVKETVTETPVVTETVTETPVTPSEPSSE